MSRIDVALDGNTFKVMVNYITRFKFSSLKIANQEAQTLHDKEYPSYDLKLIKGTVTA